MRLRILSTTTVATASLPVARGPMSANTQFSHCQQATSRLAFATKPLCPAAHVKKGMPYGTQTMRTDSCRGRGADEQCSVRHLNGPALCCLSFEAAGAEECAPRMDLASASRGSMMWWGCTWCCCCASVISASAFCSVGALASVSFLSLLTSLVTARASGSRSHLHNSNHSHS